MNLKFKKLKKKINKNGDVIKYIDSKSKYLKKISEVYLSELKPRRIKAWKINYTCDQFLTNLNGKFIFMYKKKINEKEKKKIINIYDAVYIPKKTYYGFKNVSKKEKCLILNSLEVNHKKCKFGNINYK